MVLEPWQVIEEGERVVVKDITEVHFDDHGHDTEIPQPIQEEQCGRIQHLRGGRPWNQQEAR